MKKIIFVFLLMVPMFVIANNTTIKYFVKSPIPCAISKEDLEQMCSYVSAKNIMGMAQMAKREVATLLPSGAIVELTNYGMLNSKVRIVKDGAVGSANGCFVYIKTDHLERLCNKF